MSQQWVALNIGCRSGAVLSSPTCKPCDRAVGPNTPSPVQASPRDLLPPDCDLRPYRVGHSPSRPLPVSIGQRLAPKGSAAIILERNRFRGIVRLNVAMSTDPYACALSSADQRGGTALWVEFVRSGRWLPAVALGSLRGRRFWPSALVDVDLSHLLVCRCGGRLYAAVMAACSELAVGRRSRRVEGRLGVTPRAKV
jgi:hypothetical protein